MYCIHVLFQSNSIICVSAGKDAGRDPSEMLTAVCLCDTGVQT